MSHGSEIVPRIVRWTEKEPFCCSYQRVAMSPVITFTVCDTSEHCKDGQVVTEILADTKDEWMEVCVKAPKETTEQRLKQWYTPTTKNIVNSNKTGKGAVYAPLRGQHAAKAQHGSLAAGRPVLWEQEDGQGVTPACTHLPSSPPSKRGRGCSWKDTQNGKMKIMGKSPLA